MELLWFTAAAIIIIGPWVLAGIALSRASRAREDAKRARAAADAAWRAFQSRAPASEGEPPAVPGEPSPPVETIPVPPPLEPPYAPAPPSSAPVSPPVPAPPPDVPQAAAAAALEEKIALVWFTRAGALAILVGAAYFLKYAIDNALLGPWGRIASASVSGAAALAAGEALRARTRPIWIHALQGAGIALLFLAGFGSHALYHLVPVGVAFAAVSAVALLGGALAVRHRAELLLGIALVGGLLAPVLLSTGEDRPLALFGYLLVLGGAALLVSTHLGFRVTPWIALAGTVVLGAGWYDRFFDVHPPPAVPSASRPVEEQMGRYFPLSRRLVPLGATVAFCAAWLAAHARFRRDAPRAWADGWLAASLAFAHVAPFAIVTDRPLLVAVALGGAAALGGALLARSGRLTFMLGAELLGFGLLWLALDARPSGPEAYWIAAAAIVCATHLAIVAHAWLVRGDAPGHFLTAGAAVAGLAFTGFSILLTSDAQGLLRAALVGAAAAAELALGAAVVRRARLHASAILGAALALFAAAAAFLFSGATITVVWAAMACAAAMIAARERDRWWLSGALALFVAALVRIATLDVLAAERATRQFIRSAGGEGRLEPIFLANPRAVAFAATAAALLLAARAVRRAREDWKAISGAVAAIGWALAVALAVTEARDLVLTLPAPPLAGDHAAFAAFGTTVAAARSAQWAAQSATTSLVMAACAALLVGGGFVFRDAFHRWLGLALFGVVLGKLLVVDVWRLSRLQQVAVLVTVGVLLLAAAFLYARFGKRIAAMLGGEPPRPGGGAAALTVLLASAIAAPAQALDPEMFRTARDIDGVNGPGLHAFEADADLFQASRAPTAKLGDVRIEDAAGTEVPWALRIVGRGPEERTVEGTVVDPVVLPDGSVRAVVDLGPAPPRHGELRLDLAGEEYLRPVRLEVSDDGRRFGVLAEGARVWAVRDGGSARRTWVRHPLSQARFVRVTLLPGAGDPPRIVGARAKRGKAAEAPLRSSPVAVPAAKRSPDGRETLLDIDLGAAGLPIEALELDVETPAFERRVQIFTSADGAHWIPAGGGVVWRALPGATGTAAAGLRVGAKTGGRRWIRIAVADGDSPQLEIRAIRAGWRPREIVFRAGAAGRHLLLAGADVPAPSYDLGALLERSGDAHLAPARLGPPRANPRFHEASPELPFSERHRGALSIALAALFGGLAFWAARLLRRASPRDPGGP